MIKKNLFEREQSDRTNSTDARKRIRKKPFVRLETINRVIGSKYNDVQLGMQIATINLVVD